MIVLPIRTESNTRNTPHVNFILLGLNIILFMLFHERFGGAMFAFVRDDYLVLESTAPALYQFVTYQFLHADGTHLLGNLIFLWVFGNGVNAKMGDWPYLFFYLGGGIFAAWGHAMIQSEDFHLLGASGAVAAVTTAYLVLFPRSRVTVMVWFVFFLHFFDMPAMLLIGLKVIVWDNMIAPTFGGATNVAHFAHLSGYVFGFVGGLILLKFRAISRDQFDILALWQRWKRRREFAEGAALTGSGSSSRFGTLGKATGAKERAAHDSQWDKIEDLRGRINELLLRNDPEAALEAYQSLIALDPRQCLSEREQLDIARALYERNQPFEAAAAFEAFCASYPNATDAANIRFLLGIIYARDLKRYEVADKHLTESLKGLRDEGRRTQCSQWLRDVRAALEHPAIEG